MTLIKDLIHVPERVNKGDFVLRLTEGVQDPRQTLQNYVVTEQLVKCFDHALMFIRSAVEGRTSKASYLHGSFGSGKSHFMAVLHLILQGSTAARSIPELAEVIARHNPWMEGKKFLLIPYHMIGARNMESAILGGYADSVRQIHPEAGIPGVYLAEKLFEDAQSFRARMGDAAFFAALSEVSAGEEDGWGELGGGWDADRFDRAVSAPPGDDDRLRLVGDLVDTLFKSHQEFAKSSGEGYISLDDGLSVISRHARDLGYDSVILFLDELILWLASHSADLGFVQLEGQKLAKLVEAQSADRPVPIVSFVARQRDLRDLVGKEVSGATALNFSDILGHWEGRFDTLTLEDRNLPKIAQKRVLKPIDESAKNQIDAAFEKTAKVREEVLQTLLTSEGDRAMFRQVYPFSPALVQTLIAVSSLLQRERTALKVMLQLLVDHRDSLKLGDVVPVGDLFDVIAHGGEAFSEEMRLQFENAKRLYHQKLLPLLENQHKRRYEELAALPFDDPARIGFRNDDRLIKTLLLSALAPGVESLRALNANRLAALNHGTITSPIPGREGQLVAQKVKKWAAELGEIKVGEEANPTISIQLTGVDTESIIDQARREDNPGNRIRYIRETLFDQMGIQDKDEFFLEHAFTWRNTRRTCEILFGNIRTLSETAFIPNGENWKLIIDYPFDEPNRGPMDDLSKLQEVQAAHLSGLRTVAWVPSFFSLQSQKNLGLLVVLEHVLTGERFPQYAAHLSQQDQAAARALLENQRSQLRQRVKNDLCAVYGLDAGNPEAVDSAHELTDHFQSLWLGFDPQPPARTQLRDAMEDILGQALAYQFPAHPLFEDEIKTANP
ncbi:MAG: phage resistance protein, partial [Thermodesulfobacteriota bacterium]